MQERRESIHIKYILAGLVGIVAGALLTTAVVVLAGNPAGPGTPPGNALSYTLEDIYNRLEAVRMARQARGSEPGIAPGAESGPTLSETMALAPQRDDTDGAVAGDVLRDRAFWG